MVTQAHRIRMDERRAEHALRDATGDQERRGVSRAWAIPFERAELVPELSGAWARSQHGWTWHIVRLAGRTISEEEKLEVWGARADCSWFTGRPVFSDRPRPGESICQKCAPHQPRPCLAARDAMKSSKRRSGY